MMLLAAIAATTAGIIAAPFVIEATRKPVSARTDIPQDGQFADLSAGRVFFRWHGPTDGPVAVCIHGLSTPSCVWDGLIPHLADAGFRVLSFDLFGRGFSDRPAGSQTPAFFMDQLTELLAHQKIDTQITLFGNSMGSAIAAAFAAHQPQRIRQTVLLVPAGLGHDLGTAAKAARKFQPLGSWMIHALYPRALCKGIAAERDLPTTVPDITKQQEKELQYKGFLRAINSSLGGILAQTFEHEHRTLAQHGLPVVAVWGVDDDIIPISCRDKLQVWNPNVTHITLSGAGHGLVYTHTEKLWSMLAPELIR